MEPKFVQVKFEVNPLGDLLVVWTIPVQHLPAGGSFDIEVPGFKYDLPTFASIPVPFSSKGIELEIDEVSVTDASFTFSINKAIYSNRILAFTKTNGSPTEDLVISYRIRKIVNHDGIYFVMVYPFRSPFLNSSHRIMLGAKFSYNIRKYKFWERHFSYPKNEKILSSDVFTCQKAGDEITVRGDYTPTATETIDLHLTATRFPFLIRRDIFWFIIFLFFLLIAISPYIVAILD